MTSSLRGLFLGAACGTFLYYTASERLRKSTAEAQNCIHEASQQLAKFTTNRSPPFSTEANSSFSSRHNVRAEPHRTQNKSAETGLNSLQEQWNSIAKVITAGQRPDGTMPWQDHISFENLRLTAKHIIELTRPEESGHRHKKIGS
eukprot:gene6009-254_t